MPETNRFPDEEEPVPPTLRSRVDEVLSEPRSRRRSIPPISVVPSSAELRQIVESLQLERSYYKVLRTQKAYGLPPRGEKVPPFEKLLGAFSPAMLATAQDFMRPTLVLTTKGRSFSDLLSAMDAHKTIRNQTSATSEEDFYGADASSVPDHWGAYIAEGAPMKNRIDYHKGLSLSKRLEIFSDQKFSKGSWGMNRWIYAHLMMQELEGCYPIDSNCVTILDEDPAYKKDILVPYAGWSPEQHHVFFSKMLAGSELSNAHFRQSVGGVILGTF